MNDKSEPQHDAGRDGTSGAGDVFMLLTSGFPPDTFERAAQIERECFSDPWSRRSLESFAAGGPYAFVAAYAPPSPAADKPELIGYACVCVAAEFGELCNIAVAPGRRRSGVGRTILSRALDVCASMGALRVELEVRESNTAARALYESAGFVVVGRRLRYYRRPTEDAVLMEKTLDAYPDRI
jgi:ribosomal-protein-alanine N-acetyltransferase